MSLLSSVALLAFCSFSVFCGAVAETDIDLDGRPIEVGQTPKMYGRVRLTFQPFCGTTMPDEEKAILAYERSLPDDPTFEQLREFGSNLVLFGRMIQARDLFLRAEKLRPGDLDVAVALARCFDQLGDAATALLWSKSALQRKGAGSDYAWLQARLLQAKLNLHTDPTWLNERSGLGLDFGDASRPILDPTLPKDVFPDAEKLVHAVGWHASERLQLSNTHSPLIGDLLFDLGNALAVRGAVRTAVGIYELAEEYSAPRAALLKARLAFTRRLVARAEAEGILKKPTPAAK